MKHILPQKLIYPKEIHCSQCANAWLTKSIAYRVSCPKCGFRTKNPHTTYVPTREGAKEELEQIKSQYQSITMPVMAEQVK